MGISMNIGIVVGFCHAVFDRQLRINRRIGIDGALEAVFGVSEQLPFHGGHLRPDAVFDFRKPDQRTIGQCVTGYGIADFGIQLQFVIDTHGKFCRCVTFVGVVFVQNDDSGTGIALRLCHVNQRVIKRNAERFCQIVSGKGTVFRIVGSVHASAGAGRKYKEDHTEQIYHRSNIQFPHHHSSV